MDTLTITLGEGVRGRIGSTIIRTGAIGPEATTTITVARPRGQRIQYSIAADSGFHNLLVVLDDQSVPARGTITLSGDCELMAGAQKRTNAGPDTRKMAGLVRKSTAATEPADTP